MTIAARGEIGTPHRTARVWLGSCDVAANESCPRLLPWRGSRNSDLPLRRQDVALGGAIRHAVLYPLPGPLPAGCRDPGLGLRLVAMAVTSGV
jgi:hypothetical protein